MLVRIPSCAFRRMRMETLGVILTTWYQYLQLGSARLHVCRPPMNPTPTDLSTELYRCPTRCPDVFFLALGSENTQIEPMAAPCHWSGWRACAGWKLLPPAVPSTAEGGFLVPRVAVKSVSRTWAPGKLYVIMIIIYVIKCFAVVFSKFMFVRCT